MTVEEFQVVVERRIALTRQTLDAKKHHYASDADRMHNFKVMAELQGGTPEESLLGVAVKHWFSVREMVDQFARTGAAPTRGQVDEKLGDAVCYLFLLEGLFEEERGSLCLKPKV
jgi:hypothetical protein